MDGESSASESLGRLHDEEPKAGRLTMRQGSRMDQPREGQFGGFSQDRAHPGVPVSLPEEGESRLCHYGRYKNFRGTKIKLLSTRVLLVHR
jgi:hypothetical protein